MRRPLILAVDSDLVARDRVRHELERRYGSDFRVQCRGDGPEALTDLDDAHSRGGTVALLLVAGTIPEADRAELLRRARSEHPDARRALLVAWGAWGDRGTAAAILQSMAAGDIQYYVLKPWTSPDELFHRTVAEFLQEWSRSDVGNQREVVVVGDRRTARSHEVRSMLTRNGIPHAFHDRESAQGEAVLARVGTARSQAHLVVWMPVLNGKLLLNPTDAEIAEAWGIGTDLPPDTRDFDVLVVGAGPAGLAAAVYASSEGLSTLVVEREAIGGQAGASSLIRNYLGFSRGLSGAELAQRGFQQAWVFGAHFVLTREVTSLARHDDLYLVRIEGVGDITARAVVLATGVAYRRLGIPELERLSGAGVFYGASVSEAHAMVGQRVVVVGGGNSAGQAALHLQRYAERVTILVRTPTLQSGMSEYLVKEIKSTGVDVWTDSEVVGGGGDGRLEQLQVRHRPTGQTSELATDAVFVMIGAQPHTSWLPDEVRRDRGGFIECGSMLPDQPWLLDRPRLAHETSAPGVFAVGDVRSGSVKRVASAVGEGSVVVSQVHQLLAANAESARGPLREPAR
ncbi:MAG: FAD-dependent oxidoreductase [Actinomycetota bacterium]|nr:FAD-dependent oxidoreductase [Actinomycetota bacterium]